MRFIRTLVGGLLAEMDDTIDHDRFKRLLHYSRRLAGFKNRAALVGEAIDEVLAQDEDMDAMCLSDKLRRAARIGPHASSSSFSASHSPLSADGDVPLHHPDALSPNANHHPTDHSHPTDHTELEVLLESFSKQVEEIVNEAESLEHNVQATQEIVELVLDANRNALLALDLKVSIMTLGVGAGALVAGVFGMNVRSGFFFLFLCVCFFFLFSCFVRCLLVRD